MIGASIARLALAEGCTVLCILRPGSPKENNLPVHENLKKVYSDISGYADIPSSGRYDTFFHLAWDKTFGNARDDTDAQLKNVQYTLDAVRLANRFGCSAFVGAGSQAEYGPVSRKLRGDTPVNPLSGYGIAKYAAGKLSGLLCDQLGMRHNWVRVLSVYGAMDNPYTLISYVIDGLLNGDAPELTKCEQIWDYLNERDAATAFIAISKDGISGKTYTLGSGTERTLRSYIDDISRIINPERQPLFGEKTYYDNQPMYLVADINELIHDTQWKPIVRFEDGIAEIVNIKRRARFATDARSAAK